ncbi:hypothetical protein AZE42_03592 [Rhizopogon vesiculosus]|uniref:SAP domain-containing protein n=1 Tax=Rhizopogon vesiculosus TaxID=180088 RepID=A0A1J8PHU4_9AGAM|nr:hypothetical protein AZE42_03592 [Rhizopogon vesiculosus]
MFRAVFHRHCLPHASAFFIPKHRNFVSTVLLSRTWEHETAVTLRQEAKNRGLSTKGNKSILISRIQEYEESRAVPSSQSVTLETPAASRKASSSATAPQATSPGIPPASQRASASVTPDFFSIKLPDLSQDCPGAPVQVPFLPYFRDSSSLKPEPTELFLPKLHVVSGTATHPDGGPIYNLEKPHEVEDIEQSASEPHSEPAGEHGFFRDLADDLVLPQTFRVSQVVSNAVHAVKEPGTNMRVESRPLNDAETKGVWVLLGLLAGSWIIGGWVNRAPPADEVHGMEEDKH